MGTDVGNGVGGREEAVGVGISVAVGGTGVFVEGISDAAGSFWLHLVPTRKQNRIIRMLCIRCFLFLVVILFTPISVVLWYGLLIQKNDPKVIFFNNPDKLISG
jgi:hypothetical protein